MSLDPSEGWGSSSSGSDSSSDSSGDSSGSSSSGSSSSSSSSSGSSKESSKVARLRWVFHFLKAGILWAQRSATQIDPGSAVLFKVASKSATKSVVTNPFKPGVYQPKTIAKYSDTWIRAIGYLFRTQSWEAADRPAYQLSTE